MTSPPPPPTLLLQVPDKPLAPWNKLTLSPDTVARPPAAPSLRQVRQHLHTLWLSLGSSSNFLIGDSAPLDFTHLHLYRIACAVGRVPLAHWAQHFCNAAAVLPYHIHVVRGRWRIEVFGVVYPQRAQRLLGVQCDRTLAELETELLVRSTSVPADIVLTNPNNRRCWFVPTPLQVSSALACSGPAWALCEYEADLLQRADALLVRIVQALLACGSDDLVRATAAVLELYAEHALDLSAERGRFWDALMRTRYSLWLHTATALVPSVRAHYERVSVMWVHALASHCYRSELDTLEMLFGGGGDLVHARLPIARKALPQVQTRTAVYDQQAALLAGQRAPVLLPAATLSQELVPLAQLDDAALERLYALTPALELGNVPTAHGYTSFLRAYSTLVHNAPLTHVLLVRDALYVVCERASLVAGTRYDNVLLLACPVLCHFGVYCDDAPALQADVRSALENWLRADFDVRDMHLEAPDSAVQKHSEWLVLLPHECCRNVRAMEARLGVFGARFPRTKEEHGVFAELGTLRLRTYLPPAKNPQRKQIVLPLSAPHTLHPASLIERGASAKRPALHVGDDEHASSAEPLAIALERSAEAHATRTLLAQYCDETRRSNAPPTHLLVVQQSLVPAHYSMGGGYALITYEQVPLWLANYAAHVSTQLGAYMARVGGARSRKLYEALHTQLEPLRALLRAPPPPPPVPVLHINGLDKTGREAIELRLRERAPAFALELAQHWRSIDPDGKRKVTVSADRIRCGALEISVRGQKLGSWRHWSAGGCGGRDLVGLAAYVMFRDNPRAALEHCVQRIGALEAVQSGELQRGADVGDQQRDEERQQKVNAWLTRSTQPLCAAAVHYLRVVRGLGADASRALIEDNPALRSCVSESHPVSNVRNLAVLVCTTEPQVGGVVRSLQRVYLLGDGSGKYVPRGREDPAKMSLGAIKGSVCVVQHGSADNTWVAVCEGPETALSVAAADPSLCVCTVFGVPHLDYFDQRAQMPRLCNVLLCGENDTASPPALARNAQRLLKLGYARVECVFPPIDVDDMNSVHQRHPGAAGSSIVHELLNLARLDNSMRDAM